MGVVVQNGTRNLWVRVISAIHLGLSNWDFLPVKNSVGGVWRSIVSVINKLVAPNILIRSCFKGIVGNGEGVCFWLDPWLLDEPLKFRFPSLFRLEMVKGCSVKDRVGSDGIWLWRHEPNEDDEASELTGLMDLIWNFPLSDRRDAWRWLGCNSGVFSVSSVKSIILNSFDFSSRFVMKWCSWVPIKCNLFAWKAEMGRIPTTEALKKRGVIIEDEVCPLCSSEEETVDHLFTSCLVTSVLWQKVCTWSRVPLFFAFSFRDLLELYDHCGKKNEEKEFFHVSDRKLIITHSKTLFSNGVYGPYKVIRPV
ncbi:uncharacterized protein LOC110876232 [Helianthus annuus]|uniref:uncharacterized protein LOC110876232 n=1 Tax=Helianthus annuus TaxID=4232 RepID=UPI000B8F674F|nr:uncharacterized protein LOC110876232 [Helianthus annuus]